MKGKKEAEEGARKENKKRIGRREGEKKHGGCEKTKREIFKRWFKNVKGEERKARERENGRYKRFQKGRGCIRRMAIVKSRRVKAV